MNEDVLNMEIRKFLKTVGVTSQREIEKALREAAAAGKLKGQSAVKVKMKLAIPALGTRHKLKGEIKFA
jgi:hypothetical protein